MNQLFFLCTFLFSFSVFSMIQSSSSESEEIVFYKHQNTLSYNSKEKSFYINQEPIQGKIKTGTHKALKNINDINKNLMQSSILMILLQKKEFDIVESLLKIIQESYPDLMYVLIGQKDLQGRTALHYACANKKTPISTVEALLDAGFDPDALASRKKTPLSFAAKNKRLDIIALFRRNKN